MKWIAIIVLTFTIYDDSENVIARKHTSIESPNHKTEAVCNAVAANLRRFEVREFIKANGASPGFDIRQSHQCLVDIDGEDAS